MKPWLLAAISGAPQLITQTFTSNATWVATGVNQLASLVGKGQDGTPAVDGDWGYETWKTTTTIVNNGTPTVVGPVYVSTTYYEDPPAPYCEGSYNNTTKTQTDTCYEFGTFDNRADATNGSDATAFGYTFAGGVAGPAVSATYNNVAVTLNGSYSIVVPSGGSVTITYYK